MTGLKDYGRTWRVGFTRRMSKWRGVTLLDPSARNHCVGQRYGIKVPLNKWEAWPPNLRHKQIEYDRKLVCSKSHQLVVKWDGMSIGTLYELGWAWYLDIPVLFVVTGMDKPVLPGWVADHAARKGCGLVGSFKQAEEYLVTKYNLRCKDNGNANGNKSR